MSDFLVLAGLVLVVLAGSALPAAVEAALLSVNPLRVHDMVARSVPGALKLQSLKNRLGRSLAVLVISSNVFQIFGSLMLGAGIVGVGLLVFVFGLVTVAMAYRLEDQRLMLAYQELRTALAGD